MLLENSPALEVSNESLWTVKPDSRRQRVPFSHEQRECINDDLWLWIVNDWLVRYELESNHKISKTKRHVPSLSSAGLLMRAAAADICYGAEYSRSSRVAAFQRSELQTHRLGRGRLMPGLKPFPCFLSAPPPLCLGCQRGPAVGTRLEGSPAAPVFLRTLLSPPPAPRGREAGSAATSVSGKRHRNLEWSGTARSHSTWRPVRGNISRLEGNPPSAAGALRQTDW